MPFVGLDEAGTMRKTSTSTFEWALATPEGLREASAVDQVAPRIFDPLLLGPANPLEPDCQDQVHEQKCARQPKVFPGHCKMRLSAAHSEYLPKQSTWYLAHESASSSAKNKDLEVV
jgi:hypothetical protein